MDTQYSSKDIIKMVIQAKTKGVDLYLTLARNSENYHVSNLFAELAKDGQRHKIQMEKWINSLDDVTREEAYPGEAALYLKALVDAGTFNCDAATKKALEMTEPMLILQGGRDYHATMVDFEDWRQILLARNNVQFKSFPKLNHLFMRGEGRSNPKEFLIQGNVDGEVIDYIATWVKINK